MFKSTLLIVAMAFFCQSLNAHTLWLMPSHLVLSKQDSWIAIDAAAGNMTFVADKGIILDTLTLHTPDGAALKVSQSYQGKRKSMADVQLAGDGTYRLEMANPARFITTYQLNGERMRLMADKQQRQDKIPAGASNIETVQLRSRQFAYITVNAPSNTVMALSGEGLELQSNTHPADVVAGEALSFSFYVNGRLQTGVKGVLSFDGERYRNEAGRIEFATDANGQFSFTPAHAGRYLLEAYYSAPISAAQADSIREAISYSFEVSQP